MMRTDNEYKGPLTGLNVIDFGHYYAGPMAAMLLADQGANVIRIAKPGRRELSEPQYRLLNRNKKLLTLDLKTDEGKAQALSLMSKADVVIENFRPGVMRRLGLDYDRAKDANPGLVYLSLPGFVSTDERASIQAWEGVMGAAACSFTNAHWFRQKLGFPPLYNSVPMCSAHGSMQGAIAVLAALVARKKQGAGTWIEVSQVAAAIAGITPIEFVRYPNFLGVTDAEGRITETYKPFEFNASDTQAEQLEKLDKVTRNRPLGPLMKFYPCADGRDIMIWVLTPALFSQVLGIEKTLKQECVDITGLMLSAEKRQRLMEIVAAKMLTKTAEEWETQLCEAGIAASVIRTRQEWMTLDATSKSGLFTEMNDGNSTLTVPGSFADVSGPEGCLVSNTAKEPLPIAFTDAEQLLSSTAEAEDVSAEPSTLKKGDFLKGLKVLDLTNLVAGPTATYTLAQYGAEVIKADPPNSKNLGLIAACMLEVNQGKRSILTDLTTAPGREVFSRLVRWADVVVHNSVDGIAERLGVTLAQLQAINPNVIACQFSAYGGLYRNCGGWERRPGFDPSAQSVSGMMTHYGTPDKPQPHGMISCGDIMGGIGGTFSALLGVYQKCTSGIAGEARCSLARMINYIQLPHMVSEKGSCDWGEARGQFALGEPLADANNRFLHSTHLNNTALWQRLYQCRDKWLYVGTRKESVPLLLEAVTGSPDGDVLALETAFAGQDCAYWQEKLQAVDIGCHPVISMDDIRAQNIRCVSNDEADETASGCVEVLIREDHPCEEPMIFIAPTWIRVGESHSYKRLTPAPKYGQHTAEILRELGYEDAEIAKLIDLKVSHEFLPLIGSKEAYFYEPQVS